MGFAPQKPVKLRGTGQSCHLWSLGINTKDGSSKTDLLKVIYSLQGLNITGRNWNAHDSDAIYFSIEFMASPGQLNDFNSAQGQNLRMDLIKTLAPLNGVRLNCVKDSTTNSDGAISQ